MRHAIIFYLIITTVVVHAQKEKTLLVSSPDGHIIVTVEGGTKLEWSVKHKGDEVISPSAIGLQLEGGEVLGDNAKVVSSKMEKVKKEITPINYKKSVIPDEYNQLTVRYKGDFGVLFRAYNDGVAYRIFTSRKEELTIKNEVVNFNFSEDRHAFIPFVRDLRGNEIYINSFEAL